MRVLVTGAAGAIGAPVSLELLRAGYEVRAFDRVPVSGVADTIVADLTDAQAVRRACAGMQAVVHLAAMPTDGPFTELVHSNVVGLYHLFEAARLERVSRVVLASSVQVVGKQVPGERKTAHSAAPSNHYALTKLWAEQLGEMYARVHQLSVIAARIGWMVRNPDEARRAKQHPARASYVSRADCFRFVRAALEAKDVSFEILFAIGPDGAERFDLETARERIGYEPLDSWPAGLPFPVPE